MRIAITGVSGFIGGRTAELLHGSGHEIVGLVRDERRAGHVAGVIDRSVVGTFEDPDVQQRLCDGADCVIHVAYDWRAMRDPGDNVRVNIGGSVGLLDAARRAGVGQFIYFSSIGAYHEILADRKLDENHPTWPDSDYGAAKAAVEAFLKVYHHRHGMNTVSLRPAGVYGLHAELDRSWYYRLVRQIRDGQPVDTDRGGKIVSVEDCAIAAKLCVGNAAAAGRFFVLVDCYLYDQEIARMARRICGSRSEIGETDGPGPKNHFDTSAARALGVPLNRGKEGVRAYVEELLEAMK
ncbi:MAG: hypothetical protein BIFFINMI_03206 [Phycisphaerae bacterium]|nr:hypothetical protein [Phycisphaerae bacterium]